MMLDACDAHGHHTVYLDITLTLNRVAKTQHKCFVFVLLKSNTFIDFNV